MAGVFDPGVLLQSQGLQLPDPMRLAQGAMSLAQLGNQNALAQYTLQKARRADDQANALNQVLPALLQSGFEPGAVQQALARHPEASDGIYNAYQAYQKQKQELDLKNAEADKNRSQGKEADIKGKAQAFQSIATTAYQEAQAPNNLSLSKLQSMAQFYGVQLPPPQEGMDPQSYLKMLGDQAMSVKDRITTQETGRHNTAEEGLTQARDTNTASYQRGELGVKNAELANSNMRARAAMVTADPFGLSGLNTGGGGAPAQPQQAQLPPGVTDGNLFQAALADAQKTGQPSFKIGAQGPYNVADYAGQPQGQSAAPGGVGGIQAAMQQGLHGDEFLAALPQGVAGLVKAIAEGKQPPAQGAALRSPQVQQLIMLAAQYDPSFDATQWGARASMAKDWGDQGAIGKSNLAINTVIGHLGDLKKSADTLNNTNFTPLNAAVNSVETMIGDPRYKAFDANAGAVAKELERAYRGTGGSQGDIDQMKGELSNSGSPAQMTAVIQKYVDLLQSKIEANADAYRKTMGREPPPLLSGKAQATRDSLAGNAPQSRDDAVKQAMDAISKGAPRDKVLQRLQQMGITDARL